MMPMSEAEDHGLLPRRTDTEIAAVADDPDAASAGDRAGGVRAARYGILLTTLRDWERGRAEPDRSAKILLAAIVATVAKGLPHLEIAP